MAQEGGHGISERELTCAICTEILYQPLALLDCLHTFCGACLKEWFKWQATSASSSPRSITPYSCPSCREAVRRTKADWRLNTLLEGFLKANPDKVKPEEEKNDLAKLYKPGDDVLPPIPQREDDGDSEDERLLAEVRQLSMADVDPETRRRADRAARRRRHGQYNSEDLARTQQTSQWAARQAQQARLTEARLHEHEVNHPQVEHQPSLRSLLSASDDPQDVQAEILRSIYADGLLDGVDVDNLTTEQEEELTERIAEAYRRRQRRRERDRSSNRERRSPNASTVAMVENQSPRLSQQSVATEQTRETRSRPPISRPHLFEESAQASSRNHRRSQSATSQQSDRSQRHTESGATPTARSATDLSQHPSSEQPRRERRSRHSGTGRSVTDPDSGAIHEQIQQCRANFSDTAGQSTMLGPSTSGNRAVEAARRQTVPVGSNPNSPPAATVSPQIENRHTVRSEISHSAFAPEAVVNGTDQVAAPEIQCNRCSRPSIQHQLHYNCRWCRDGNFNLCFYCYRDGRGCDHWFGFGFRAFERWYRNAPPQNWPMTLDRPHILAPRRFAKTAGPNTAQRDSAGDVLYEGAFCESCFVFANDCYWYCNVCLEGAWGFCDRCVKQGKHCTHSLLVVAHVNTIRGGHLDPTKLSFIGLPHLRQDSYVNLPVSTSCDICIRPIQPNTSRLHCYECNAGDYDICNECYEGLVSQGKISQANGPNGWRRCFNGHRMAVIDIQSTTEGSHVRRTIREPIGGWTLKEDNAPPSQQTPPAGLHPSGGTTMRCLALYNYFPKEGVLDELTFPKNAEVNEVLDENGDWYVGHYAGRVGLFPSNHVRIL